MILAIARTARIHVAVTFHGVNRKNGWWNIGGHRDIHQRALIEKLVPCCAKDGLQCRLLRGMFASLLDGTFCVFLKAVP